MDHAYFDSGTQLNDSRVVSSELYLRTLLLNQLKGYFVDQKCNFVYSRRWI